MKRMLIEKILYTKIKKMPKNLLSPQQAAGYSQQIFLPLEGNQHFQSFQIGRSKLRGIKPNLKIKIAISLLFLLMITGVWAQNPFNLEVEIAKTYKTISPGEDLWFTTKIMNLAGEKRMDITLVYEIYDNKSSPIASKSETVAIETQASFVGSLKIPVDSQNGDYHLNVNIQVNGNKEAEGTDNFKIIKKNNKNTIQFAILALILLSLALVVYLAIKSKAILEKHQIKSSINRIIRNRLGKK